MDRFARSFLVAPSLMSIDATIDCIRAGKSSIARFGDGEMDIMRGGSIFFQDPDPALARRLRMVLESSEPGLLVALPPIFGDLSFMTDNARLYYRRYLPRSRYAWYRATDPKRLYGNSFISRLYMDWADKTHAQTSFQRLRAVWNERDVVFIEGEESRLGMGNDLFDNARSIRRIIGPKRNAFQRVDQLYEAACSIEKDALLIIALGPTATVLAYELHRKGYTALDLGHVDIEYEWMRMAAIEKVPVPGKHVSEAKYGDVVASAEDEWYRGQIVCDVSGSQRSPVWR